MNADPFGTAGLRDTVLRTWCASPARFREDANTEEDYARGYYRDRVLVDLAQNGADAAVRAGRPGRLLVRLEPDGDATRLVVANTGTPLDAAGVAALASMRASAKRTPGPVPEDSAVVGRFGVGFAAVRAVADTVEVRSTTGTVRFCLTATRALLDQTAGGPGQLADEVARRGDALPVLRLPLAGPVDPWPGYDTAVVAWLRDDAAVAAVRAQLDDVGDPMLLGLPGLVEIVVETPDGSRRVADVTDRWRVRTAAGTLDAALLADRPVEERDRTGWRVTWALPQPSQETHDLAGTTETTDRPGWSRVVHAPTPTDDPCSLPALLVATLPLDPTRRHVAPGRAADAVLAHAAAVYAALAAAIVADGAANAPVDMVPTGLAAGPLDAQLRQLVVAALRRAPVLAGPHGPVAPDQAVALAAPAGRVPHLVESLSRWVPGLVGLPSGGTAPLRVLDVPVRDLAEVVEALPAEPGPGTEPPWTDLYDAVATVLPEQAESLAALPVRLADGRVVRGGRGTVVLDGALTDRLSPATVAALGEWGVRLVDPTGVHPVLERLGAVALDGPGLLALPEVREAILRRQDDPGDDALGEVAAAVVELVGLDPPDPAPPVLGLVELPAADGEPTPAHGLVVPGSLAHRLFDDRVMAPVSTALAERVGRPVLRTLGVRSAPVVVRVPDVVADPAVGDLDGTDDAALLSATLDAWPDYLAWLADRFGPGAWIGDLHCIADLDAVAADAWPTMLATIAGDRDLRTALLDPVRAPEGSAPSYSAWWLTRRAGLGLDAPFALHPHVLPGWLPDPPAVLDGLDDAVRRALGGIGGPDELGLSGWAQVLDASRAGEPVDLNRAVEVWRAFATLAQDPPGASSDLPPVLPALVGADRAVLVRRDCVVVAGSPMWCQRTDLGAVLPAPAATAAALADRLDRPLAGDQSGAWCPTRCGFPARVDAPGTAEPVPAEVAALLGAPDVPTSWQVHDELTVDGFEVEWWVDTDGTVHAVHLAGLAAGLAQVTDRWPDRWAVEAVLTDPTRAPEALLDQAFT
ncbi:MAG: ATP-binding protein [Micrococcales bacterium]|nr:ATP-binding protein [Micrococcales bacterium]